MELNSTTTAAATAQPTAAVRPQISSDFETFLKMLTVQMQNQDPLNPVDSSDYAVQLATFSSVEQQVQTNDLLRGLQSQMGASDMAEMANWVGKEARSTGSVYVNGSPVTLYPTMAAGAERAEIVITNSSGVEVGKFTIPTTGAPFEWAGVTTDGYPYPTDTYTFDVLSYSGQDFLGTAPAASYAPVTEVRRTSDGGTVVVLAGQIEVAAADITALRSGA